MITMILLPLLLIFVGGLIGTFAASIGIGGGILMMPFLLLVLRIAPANAVAVSLFAITGTTASASIGYLRLKKVDLRLALLYDIFDIPGVFVGALFTNILPEALLIVICGGVMCTLSLLIIRRGWQGSTYSDVTTADMPTRVAQIEIAPSSLNSHMYLPRNLVIASVSSFVGGLITGLVGMSGGLTDTTTMILLGVPVFTAVATSEVAMLLTNLSGVFMQGILGHLIIELAIPLTIGTFIGAQFGCRLSSKISTRQIRLILGGIALLTGVRLLATIVIP